MTAHEKATALVKQWIHETGHLSFSMAVERLGFMIARAIDEASQDAYGRGLQDAFPPLPLEEGLGLQEDRHGQA